MEPGEMTMLCEGLKRIAEAIEAQNKILLDNIRKVVAKEIGMQLKEENKAFELRDGTGAKVIYQDENSKVTEESKPKEISGPAIPNTKEMTITIQLIRLSDSGKAYYFTWVEGERDIYLPKSVVDKMNKSFEPLLNVVQAIKVPTNMMRDK